MASKGEGYWSYRETNPITGRKYYDWQVGVKAHLVNQGEPPEEPPTTELLTKDQYQKFRAKQIGIEWDANTGKDGRPPIGGAQDD